MLLLFLPQGAAQLFFRGLKFSNDIPRALL
jgi:hypothetical protein